MQQVSFSDTIDPSTLDQEAKAKLCQKLYAVHNRIFYGADVNQFEKKIFAPHAIRTKLRVFNNINSNAVGYCALHVYEKMINSEKLVIFRVETGMIREYRKQGNVFSFFFKEAIKYKVLHPFKKSYLFCTLIHPSSYHLISKYFFHYYPNKNIVTPSDILELMNQIADSFQEVKIPDSTTGVRNVGRITRQTPEEQREWAMSPEPDTRFFLKMNPDYNKGHGLMTLVPMSILNILMTTFTFLFYKGSNQFRRSSEKLTVKGS